MCASTEQNEGNETLTVEFGLMRETDEDRSLQCWIVSVVTGKYGVP